MKEEHRNVRSEANDLFQAFLQSTKEEEEQILSQLVALHAQPLVDEIIRFKLSPSQRFQSDSADLRNDILVQLLQRLRTLREDPSKNPIRSFRDYVAVVSYNACSNYFRQKYPQRESLKNRLRYILRHDPKFEIWNEEEEWLCGQSGWKGRKDVCSREKLTALSDAAVAGTQEQRALAAIFAQTKMPVKFDDLLDLFAVPSQEPSVHLEVLRGSENATTDSEPAAFSRLYLQQTWTQICALPVRQRVALLLGLRDENGSGILIAFPAAGIASARKIAEALEMPAERLAMLWKDLPLDDLRIAELLGVTRQQVINLRKCSRERLNRNLSRRAAR